MSQMNRVERIERRRKRKEQKRKRYEELGLTKPFRKNKKVNKHHLLNKCKGGTWDYHNILWIYINRHQMWHQLFRNLNLDEVIELLQRVKLAKEHQTEAHPR